MAAPARDQVQLAGNVQDQPGRRAGGERGEAAPDVHQHRAGEFRVERLAQARQAMGVGQGQGAVGREVRGRGRRGARARPRGGRRGHGRGGGRGRRGEQRDDVPAAGDARDQGEVPLDGCPGPGSGWPLRRAGRADAVPRRARARSRAISASGAEAAGRSGPAGPTASCRAGRCRSGRPRRRKSVGAGHAGQAAGEPELAGRAKRAPIGTAWPEARLAVTSISWISPKVPAEESETTVDCWSSRSRRRSSGRCRPGSPC